MLASLRELATSRQEKRTAGYPDDRPLHRSERPVSAPIAGLSCSRRFRSRSHCKAPEQCRVPQSIASRHGRLAREAVAGDVDDEAPAESLDKLLAARPNLHCRRARCPHPVIVRQQVRTSDFLSRRPQALRGPTGSRGVLDVPVVIQDLWQRLGRPLGRSAGKAFAPLRSVHAVPHGSPALSPPSSNACRPFCLQPA